VAKTFSTQPDGGGIMHLNRIKQKFYQKYWVSGFCPSSGIVNTRKQRFGNRISFLPQVRAGRHLLCWVP
jgi:hypothetical protein